MISAVIFKINRKCYERFRKTGMGILLRICKEGALGALFIEKNLI